MPKKFCTFHELIIYTSLTMLEEEKTSLTTSDTVEGRYTQEHKETHDVMLDEE